MSCYFENDKNIDGYMYDRTIRC